MYPIFHDLLAQLHCDGHGSVLSQMSSAVSPKLFCRDCLWNFAHIYFALQNCIGKYKLPIHNSVSSYPHNLQFEAMILRFITMNIDPVFILIQFI